MPHKDPAKRAEYLKAWRAKNAKEANRRYYEAHRDERKAYMAEWRRANPDKVAASRARYKRPADVKARHREYTKRQTAKARKAIIAAYGSQCVCCGEAEPLFLTIDHVNGGGAAERRRGITAPVLYRNIIKAGFPPEYRLLCWNCNAAAGLHGRCPHANGVKGARHHFVYEREQDRLL